MAEYNSRQARNYDFVKFPKEPNCNFITDINKRYEEDDYSGRITLKITTVDNLYLGGGYTSFDKDNGFINETLEESGKAVIPGSSVKGAVRQVCRAISDGCIPIEKNDRYELDYSQKKKCSIGKTERINGSNAIVSFHICMVCDMFGMMGLGSKIKFSDFVCDEKDVFKIVSVPKLPLMNVDGKEGDKPYKGYKFYKTFCEPINVGNSNKVRAVKSGAVFNGAIDFEGLKGKELALLMCSLGISKEDSFSHKLGGYRLCGLGTVNFSVVNFMLNDEEKTTEDAILLAKQHINDYIKNNDDAKKRFDYLRKLMEYKE